MTRKQPTAISMAKRLLYKGGVFPITCELLYRTHQERTHASFQIM